MYVIVYNEKEIVFEGEVPDNTITYYPDKGYYCKIFKTEEEYLKYQKVTSEVIIDSKITTATIDICKDWLKDLNVVYSVTANLTDLKTAVVKEITNSNYPDTKKGWVTVAETMTEEVNPIDDINTDK